VTYIITSDEVVPSDVKDLLEAPLTQRINSRHVSFIRKLAGYKMHNSITV